MLFSQAEMDRTKKGPRQPQLFDVSEITEEQFWNEAEARVVDALRDVATHVTNGGRLRRNCSLKMQATDLPSWTCARNGSMWF